LSLLIWFCDWLFFVILLKKCRFIRLCSWHIPMISKFKSYLTTSASNMEQYTGKDSVRDWCISLAKLKKICIDKGFIDN
jgi:hypothetical protein